MRSKFKVLVELVHFRMNKQLIIIHSLDFFPAPISRLDPVPRMVQGVLQPNRDQVVAGQPLWKFVQHLKHVLKENSKRKNRSIRKCDQNLRLTYDTKPGCQSRWSADHLCSLQYQTTSVWIDPTSTANQMFLCSDVEWRH